MFTKNLYIPIPARAGAEETRLHVKLVAENETSLTSKPYIFMLPGGPGANHSHYKYYECLQEVANVVFYDPRGCGLSNKGSPSSYTMDNYIQDLDIIRQELGLKKIQLVGKSYGAMCALGYALRFPNIVTHLVLAAGSPSFKNLVTAKAHVAKNASVEQKAVCEKLFAGTFRDLEDLNLYFDLMDPYYSYKIKNGLPTNIPTAEYPFSYEALNLGFGDFLRRFNYIPMLKKIDGDKCQTLVIAAEEDWITAKEHSETMAKLIPNAKLVVFAESNHSLEIDVPEPFFRTIGDFIRVTPEKISKYEAKLSNFNFFYNAKTLTIDDFRPTDLQSSISKGFVGYN